MYSRQGFRTTQAQSKAGFKEFLRTWYKELGVKKVKVPMNYKNAFESLKIASGKRYPQILQWYEV